MVNAAGVPTSNHARTPADYDNVYGKGLDTIMMIATDYPHLAVTPGEWYTSDVFTQTRHDLRHSCDNSAAVDCNEVIRNNLISRRLCLPPEEFSAGIDGMDNFPETDCAAADSGVADMNDLIFRRLNLSPVDCADGRNTAVDAMKFAVIIFRRTKLLPDEFSAGRNGTIYGTTWGLSRQHAIDQ